jgi:asparagine synthase (glutamine-hydrolysing)
MCGICGIIGSYNDSRIESMVAAMHHRGPDDYGIFKDEGIALGMARLSIIDPTPNGHQPMQNRDGSVWMVYNGETYNFRDERDILQKKGYAFRSTSDTEVVLNMYEEYGDDFLLRLRGMFALAIYDRRRGPQKTRVLLARDHLGIKPLLYMKKGDLMVFASEMKSMLASGLVERQFDPESLRLLLTYGSILQPMTAVSGVKMLLPGHRMIIQNGKIRNEKFWKLDVNRVNNLRKRPYGEQVEYLRDALKESVRLQMVSDVPIGAFLSGGVDSSLLCALMAQECGSRVKTFSVGFESEGTHIDESNDALRTADYLGTDHSRVVVTGKEMHEKIFHIARALDQPSVDGVNSYFISQAARQAVTVAISGTGGDELFAGYPWFINMALRYQKKTSYYKLAMSRMLKMKFFDALSKSKYANSLEQARMYSGFISQYAREYFIFGVNGTTSILSSEYQSKSRTGREMGYDIIETDEIPFGSVIERVCALCLRGYTQNQLLRDIDAVSMSQSLEVRVPFMDHLIVDIALSLPDDAKMGSIADIPNPVEATYRETGVKRILIDAGKGLLLPPDMDLQKKRGFSMPFDAWLKGPLRKILDDALSERSVASRGFFNNEKVQSLKKIFYEGGVGWPYPWLLMIIELWCREIFD